MTFLIGEIKQETAAVQNTLQGMNAKYDTNAGAVESKLVEQRIVQAQHRLLTRNLLAVKNEYNMSQSEYRQKWKERLQRQIAFTGRTATDEQLEQMIDTGNCQTLIQNIDMQIIAAKRSLDTAESREADIRQLEQSILDLHDMFMDMAMVIEQQGELVDVIEKNVGNAKNQIGYVRPYFERMTIAENHARKKKICLGIVVAILIAILTAVIVTSATLR
ncbi:syntaxin-like [Watersipora subatra]|uniref:syntaxin-like n=1 Tax=Watersipora subatra TaxID=2589382 RepID=UPI00355C683F